MDDMATLTYFKTVLWPRAYGTQDTDLLDELLDDTFEMIDAEGNISTKAAELAHVSAHAWDPGEFQYVIERLSVYGDSAVVAGRGEATSYTYRSSNVLVRRGDGWRAVASHVSGVERR